MFKTITATGIDIIDKKLSEYEGINACYSSGVLVDVAVTARAHTVILSPHLKTDDLLNDIIIPLRENGIDIIFLPGDITMSDTRYWLKELIPWGVYSYVFDPVTVEKILDRIQNPWTLGDLKRVPYFPQEILEETQYSKISSIVNEIEVPSITVEENKPSDRKSLFSKFKNKSKKETSSASTQQNNPVQINQNSLPVIAPKEIKKSPKKPGLFCKTGYIKEGKFHKAVIEDIEDIKDILKENLTCAGIVIKPDLELIKKYRRESQSLYIPLVVLKGKKEHLAVGADYIPRKVNKALCQEITNIAEKARSIWNLVSKDELTGLYTRKFLNIWLREHRNRPIPYSLVMLDIDRFKSVNDTYGHDAGDAVLKALGNFLSSNIREVDLCFRYGGEEICIILPYTDSPGAYSLIDRLRQRWSSKEILLPGGITIKTTFSAGVAEWHEGFDPQKAADEMLYKAKEKGRNRVEYFSHNIKNIALLSSDISLKNRLKQEGFNIVIDYKDADVFIVEKETLPLIVKEADNINQTFYILFKTPAEAFKYAKILTKFKNKAVCLGIEELIRKLKGLEEEQSPPKEAESQPIINTAEVITDIDTQEEKRIGESLEKQVITIPATNRLIPKPKVHVMPGARVNRDKNTLSISKNSVIYVVCPSRPAVAGEIAVEICKESSIKEIALVCASGKSTACISYGIPPKDLIECDWRFPRAKAPIEWDNVLIWPVDPYKNITTSYDVHHLIDSIKPVFNLVVVDCAGDLEICNRIAGDECVLVIYKEGDASDVTTAHWVKNYNIPNIVAVSPAQKPVITEAENGYIIQLTPNSQAYWQKK